METFIFKVEQYNNGEGYEGFFLVLAEDTKEALDFLQRNLQYTKICSYGGTIRINQVNPSEILKNFSSNRVFELVGDNYN